MRAGADGEDHGVLRGGGAHDEVQLLVLEDHLLGLAEVGEVQRRLDVVQDDAVVRPEEEQLLAPAAREAVDGLAVPGGEDGADRARDPLDGALEDVGEDGHGIPTSESTCTASSRASSFTIRCPATSWSTQRLKAVRREASNRPVRRSTSASARDRCRSGMIESRKRMSQPHSVRVGVAIWPGWLTL